ncbi:hypothetical protein [Bifidobacterium lemurum]|nr:hypothetical protein [Bifidobacterium lemurum]QOL34074.1 hypothetical protein BL8807_10075 [Bifidobacterium lemurum]
MMDKIWQFGLTLMTMGFISSAILFAASVVATPFFASVDGTGETTALPGLFGMDLAVAMAVALVVTVIGLLICMIQITQRIQENKD